LIDRSPPFRNRACAVAFVALLAMLTAWLNWASR